MTVILGQTPFAQTIAKRIGFVPLAELSLDVPHWREAKDLDKVLRAMDSRLRVGYIYDPVAARDNRWAVVRYADDGSQQLVRIVQDENQGYLPPDQRVFLDIQKHRLDGPNGRMWIKEALNQEERLAAAKEKMKAEERAEFEEAIAKHVRDNRFKGRDTSKAFIQ